MFRQPVWRSLTVNQFGKIRTECIEREVPIPAHAFEVKADDGLTVGWELHVDDIESDEWAAWRALQPLGGELSARFPGGRPVISLASPPDLPDPGLDLSAADPELLAEEPASVQQPGPDPDDGARITDAQITKMKVAELREALKARGLDESGVKAQLVERLQAHNRSGNTAAALPAAAAARARRTGQSAGQEEEEEDDESVVYDVGKVLKRRVSPDGRLEFLVRWQGYADDTQGPL